MGACGAGYGSLDPAFARRVELLLVHAELQERLPSPPSLEVFVAEHRAACTAAGRTLPYRATLARLLAGSAAA